MYRLVFIIILTWSIVACNKDQPIKAAPELLTVEAFNELDKKMLTDDEKEFDLLWNEMKSRLYFTIQSKGIEFYSLEDRSEMAGALEFHVGLNSEYVTKKHGTSIEGVASLLEWADMYDFELKQYLQRKKKDKEEQNTPIQ